MAAQPIGLAPFQVRCILPVAEKQSRTRGSGQSGGVTDQPQCPGLWHSSSPSARSLSRSPSSPPPSFTQSPSPPLSLVRDGQTSPRRPRLVVSRSRLVHTGLGSSSLVAHVLYYLPPPHANSFVLGPAVIKHKHRYTPSRSPAPRSPSSSRPLAF